MEIDPHLIKSNKLFSSLDDAGLKKLISKFQYQHIAKNKFLFRQGDLSDGLYVVITGKLLLILKTKTKERKILREVHIGETVGEVGAFSHEPRGVSAKAVDNMTVAQLKHDDFFELCREYPDMLFETMNVLQQRARSLIEMLSTNEPEKKHIALIPANKHVSLKNFSTLLVKELKKIPNVAVLSDYDEKFLEHHKTSTELEEYVNKMNEKNKKIIYILEPHDTLLSKLCYDHVDVIYVVGEGKSKAHISPDIAQKIKHCDLTYKVKPELILLYEKKTHLPGGTAHWLKLFDFGMQHNIRTYKDTDIQRISRFLTSTAIGVVLGGGGVRSWAHIGAIKGLQESNIPIDLICGTSGGAIVAGFYALNESIEDPHDQLSDLTKITHKAVSVTHLTWPAVSLFDGAAYTEKQKKIFSNHAIENLWIPFFCVSCNLGKSTAIIHRRGLLWKKIRASTAVPGIFPPVVMQGQLHLDGGIVNNLPVDLLKKISPSISTVIAVELIHTKNHAKDYRFPAILPLGKTVLAKLKIKYKDYKFPSFVDTFLKSLLAGSSAKQNENALAADILVSPDLSAFDLLRLSEKEQNHLIEIGHKATLKALAKPRKKFKIVLPPVGVNKHKTDT